jgi:hypothetical protein
MVAVASSLLLSAAMPLSAQLRIGNGLPRLTAGIALPECLDFVRVPGHPACYASQVISNLFLYAMCKIVTKLLARRRAPPGTGLVVRVAGPRRLTGRNQARWRTDGACD